MSENNKKKPAGPRFKVRVPAGPAFGPMRVHTPFSLRFVDGVAETDNAAAADHCADCGYEVADLHDGGKVRNPLPDTTAAEAAAEEVVRRAEKK